MLAAVATDLPPGGGAGQQHVGGLPSVGAAVQPLAEDDPPASRAVRLHLPAAHPQPAGPLAPEGVAQPHAGVGVVRHPARR